MAIFDFHAGTGEQYELLIASFIECDWLFTEAVNIVAKNILATTEARAPVAVMCNSTTVSPYFSRFTDSALLHALLMCADFHRRWVQMLGWTVHSYESWLCSMISNERHNII